MLPSAKLNALTLERNIPVSITVELTRRCPLACRHCYLPETAGRARAPRELDVRQWEHVFRQLARAGGLYLVFTGGEPLLRPDLAELCRRAKKLKFDLRIFSTGLGMTRALAAELKEAGVSAFEISFYGRPGMHDGITGLKGSFVRSLAAARLLKKTGLGIKIKTPLMKKNISARAWLQALAKREGFGISFDPIITAANDGNASALPLRLTGTQLAKAVKFYGKKPSFFSASPSAPSAFSLNPLSFLCSAGRNVCAVGPDGELYSCLQLPVKLGNLTRLKFADIWKNNTWLKKWRLAGLKDLKECAACPHIDFCSRCPGVSLIEEGDLFAPNKPACEIASVVSQQ